MGKKLWFWHSRKLLKLVIMEKMSSGRQYRLCKIPQHAEGQFSDIKGRLNAVGYQGKFNAIDCMQSYYLKPGFWLPFNNNNNKIIIDFISRG